MLETIDGADYTARRTTGHNCFMKNQTPATDNTVEIGNVDALFSQLRRIKLGPARCAVTGYESLAHFAAEDHAADRVNCDHFRLELMSTNVFRAASHCAASAGRAEEIVGIAAETLADLTHRHVISFRVIVIGILVGPVTIRNQSQQRLHAIDARLKKVSRTRALGHHIDDRAVRL